MEHRVVGVVGASGGLGASTLAVALAVRAAASVGATVCVDGAFERGGLDVTACVEHVPGLRWTDLSGLRGEVDAVDLLRSLPTEGVVRVLAARGELPPDDVVHTCLHALSSICGVTVVDLGGSLGWAEHCTDVVLISGVTARHLADASAMAAGLGRLPVSARLVLRAGRREAVTAEEVAGHLDLPLATTVRDDPRVVADADRARVPGSRRGGGFVAAVDQLLAELDLRGVIGDRSAEVGSAAAPVAGPEVGSDTGSGWGRRLGARSAAGLGPGPDAALRPAGGERA